MQSAFKDRDDHTLLADYIKSSEDAAFEAIVSRYLNLVFGVALRSTGNENLAEEISQTVFTVLARKAAHIRNSTPLCAWLIKTTRLEAKKALRGEYRRSRKIKAYAHESKDDPMENNDDNTWNAALPHLDEALALLNERDREIIVQRFYRRMKFREIAELQGKKEDSVRKHLSRILDRLGTILHSKGVVVPAAALAAGLAAEFSRSTATVSAPSVASSAMAAVADSGSIATLSTSLMSMANLKQTTAVAALALAASTTGFHWHQNKQLSRRAQEIGDHIAATTSPAPVPPGHDRESGANPNRFIRQAEFQWSDLIDLLDNMQYEKMRGSREAFGALQDKLEELDAQHQFHGKDLPLVLDELERAGALPSLIHRVGTSLANLCAQRDPEGTADAVLQDDRIGNWRLGFALEVLGKQNPERALEWFEEHLDDGSLDPKGASDAKLVEDSMGSLLAGVAQSDLGSAIDYLMESPERTAKRGIYRLAFVLQTPEQQREVLELTADNKALQTHTVAAFARSKIESQSADAAWEFLTHLPVDRSAEDINTIMIDILNREINRDMHLAPDIASWLGRNSEAFASDGTHRKVLQNALSKWKVVDMDQATAWEEDHSNLIK